MMASFTNRLEFLIACSMADRWGGRAGGQTGLRRAAPAGVLAMNRRCGCAAAGAAHRPWSVAGGLAARKWRGGAIFVPAGVFGHVAKKVARRENSCNHLRKQYFFVCEAHGKHKIAVEYYHIWG